MIGIVMIGIVIQIYRNSNEHSNRNSRMPAASEKHTDAEVVHTANPRTKNLDVRGQTY